MSWVGADGDLWLLAMFVIAGAMPVGSDVVKGRPLGAEATIGGLVAVVALVALVRRAVMHLRAAAVRRRLLR